MTQAAAKKQAGNANTPRTASKEVRRGQLIDATISSIAKHGISGTTMTTVTGMAGLSLGIVNFHFQSKQKLFEETLVFLASEHRDHWQKAYRDADLSPEAKLLAIVDAHFHPKICSRKKLAVWFAFYGEAGRRAVYRSLMDDIDDERVEVTTSLLAQLKEATGAAHVDPEAVAYMLETLYDGHCLNILMCPDEFDQDMAKRQIRNYLSMVFPGQFETQEV
jgi:TetR/AcrR family transcriptional repressor of bet genes